MFKKIFQKIIYVIPVIVPSLVHAQRSVKGFADSVVTTIGDYLMPLLFVAALTYFTWGVVTFIRDAENSEERQKGKNRIIWGIIALFAMTAYFGLTSILTQTAFGTSPFLPQLFTN